MPLVTLMTDFGLKDSYVAEVKAVLLSQVPNLTIVDLTHEIPAFNISAGAFQLFRSYSYFPATAFHLAVVDPGVGTERKCLFIRTSLGSFIGPDNGLLNWAVEDAEKRCGRKSQIFEIPIRSAVRPTFYGRDVFAPFLATHLRGKKARLLRLNEVAGESFPEAELQGTMWEGTILCEDHFGNLVTSVSFEKSGPCEARIGKTRLTAAPNYLSIPNKRCALIQGSHGFWEIAAKKERAATLLKLKVGDSIHLFPSETR